VYRRIHGNNLSYEVYQSQKACADIPDKVFENLKRRGAFTFLLSQIICANNYQVIGPYSAALHTKKIPNALHYQWLHLPPSNFGFIG